MNMELSMGEKNRDIQLPSEITEMINKCFYDLYSIIENNKKSILKDFENAENYYKRIRQSFDVGARMQALENSTENIVGEQKVEFIKSINEKWERIVESVLDNMEAKGKREEELDNIQSLVNTFIDDIKKCLNKANENLLNMLQNLRCSKFD